MFDKRSYLIGFTLALAAAQSHAAPHYRFTDLGALAGEWSRAVSINDHNQVVGWAVGDKFGSGSAVLWSNGEAINLESISTGWRWSDARGINNAGQIVGSQSTLEGEGTLWSNGTASGVTREGGTAPLSNPTAINNAGQVVGWSNYSTTWSPHATVWNDGKRTFLGLLSEKSVASHAASINNKGDIVGYDRTNDELTPVLWSNGQTTALETLGKRGAEAYDINDAGQIVGYSYFGDSLSIRATLWTNGQVVELDGVSGGKSIRANGINNHGDIVGLSMTRNYYDRATLWSNGMVIDLNEVTYSLADWTLIEARAINNIGSIVGVARNRIGHEHAFLLTVAPVPEPETYAMVLGSLALFGAVRKRRKQKQAA